MTTGRRRIALVLTSVVLLNLVALYVLVRGHGFDARAQPGAIETTVAGRIRRMAIPSDARDRANPVPATGTASASRSVVRAVC